MNRYEPPVRYVLCEVIGEHTSASGDHVVAGMFDSLAGALDWGETHGYIGSNYYARQDIIREN